MALGSRGASRAAPRRGRPRSCVWWFLFGALVGGFGVGSYWMKVAPELVPPPVAAIPKTERPAPRPSRASSSPISCREHGGGHPRRRQAAAAPGGSPGAAAKPAAKPIEPGVDKPKAATAAAAPAGTYILQVGSFKTAKDAEHMKAQLAMLGVSTPVQSVTLKDGGVWHRVVTGPMDSKKAVEETRAALKQHGKGAMEIKVK